jgi:hypothetical protein
MKGLFLQVGFVLIRAACFNAAGDVFRLHGKPYFGVSATLGDSTLVERLGGLAHAHCQRWRHVFVGDHLDIRTRAAQGVKFAAVGGARGEPVVAA